MFDSFKKLKLAGAFLGVPDDAAAAPESLDISELFGRLSLKDLRAMTLPADTLLEQPGVRALFESRYMPEPEPLDRSSTSATAPSASSTSATCATQARPADNVPRRSTTPTPPATCPARAHDPPAAPRDHRVRRQPARRARAAGLLHRPDSAT
jgi:hypothetical protein